MYKIKMVKGSGTFQKLKPSNNVLVSIPLKLEKRLKVKYDIKTNEPMNKFIERILTEITA